MELPLRIGRQELGCREFWARIERRESGLVLMLDINPGDSPNILSLNSINLTGSSISSTHQHCLFSYHWLFQNIIPPNKSSAHICVHDTLIFLTGPSPHRAFCLNEQLLVHCSCVTIFMLCSNCFTKTFHFSVSALWRFRCNSMSTLRIRTIIRF